jgi:predicted RNase H-like HicB family nuclease
MRSEYHFVINWSAEDQSYVGRCPDLFIGGVHGDDPEKVFKEIRKLASWVIETQLKDGKPL